MSPLRTPSPSPAAPAIVGATLVVALPLPTALHTAGRARAPSGPVRDATPRRDNYATPEGAHKGRPYAAIMEQVRGM